MRWRKPITGSGWTVPYAVVDGRPAYTDDEEGEPPLEQDHFAIGQLARYSPAGDLGLPRQREAMRCSRCDRTDMDSTKLRFPRGWPGTAAAGLSGAAAVLFTVLQVTDTPEPVRMPVTPHLLTTVAGVAVTTLVLVGTRAGLRYRARAAIGTGCVAALAAGCIAAVPHTIMTLVVWAGALITGGQGPFDVTPAWVASAAYLVGVAAAASLMLWLVIDRRREHGRCVFCGHHDPEPAQAWRSLPIWAGMAVLGALPYGMLKLCWALGFRIGLNGRAFDEVTFTSPGFGDTVVLTGVALVVAIGMGRRLAARWLRPVLMAVGALGSLMLLPVGIVALVYTAELAWGLRTIDDQEIAPWAFLVVYSSFLLWGIALATLTVGYARSTRPWCARHPSTALRRQTDYVGWPRIDSSATRSTPARTGRPAARR